MNLKRILSLQFLMLMFSIASFAQVQDAALSGKVTDGKTGEDLPFATIEITNGIQKKTGQSDFDGTYRFTGMNPGKYTVTVILQGYKAQRINNVDLIADKTQSLNIKMETSVLEKDEVVIVEFKKPLFEKDQTLTSNTITKEQIQRAPVKGIGYLANTSSGANSAAGGISIRGGRTNGTVYFVDGVKVIGAGLGMAQSAIEQMSVVTGGVPAEYGDATGGIISITTRGPSPTFSGGFDIQTSQYLDAYGYNSVEGSITGPLVKKKYYSMDGKDSASRPLIGFFLSGIFNYSKDGSPSGIPLYRVKPDVLEDIQNNPLRQVIDPVTGFVTYQPATKFITLDQMETTKYRPNVAGFNYNVTGKLDYQPSQNFNITLGGNYNYSKGNGFVRQFSLVNTDKNPVSESENIRGFLRFRQNFINSKDKDATIKDAYYVLQFEYQRTSGKSYDPDFKDRLFEYGYVGQFQQYTSPFYFKEDRNIYDPTTGKRVDMRSNYFLGNFNDSIKFVRGGFNRITENYTQSLFDFNRGGRITSLNSIQQSQGLINGFTPNIVNNLWSNVGTTTGGYSESSTDQYSINFQTVANIKKHSIKFGVQFDQRISRGYNANASGLWTLARQLANRHLVLDTANPIFVRDVNGDFVDTVNFNYISGGGRSYFDIQLRDHLIKNGYTDEKGRPIGEFSQINTDNLKPSDLKLSMFSADELLNVGNSYVNYYGYDYLGNVQKRGVSTTDFLNDSINRRIAPYQPIYVAGFIQDKFEYKDITFNIGIRVDRFDANQKVLKDAYSIFPTRTVKELEGKSFGGVSYKKPDNIGDEFVPYVNDPINPTSTPLGYRDPSTNKFYDATGVEVADVNSLASLNSGQLFPYLAASANKENYKRPVLESFKDYDPQTTFMPRVSFSFPISQEAVFFANYNILTQRPKEGNFATIDDYYYLQARSTGAIANPALRPEKRINYEIGFKQKVSDVSALTIQAFYGEIRDLIQIQQLNFAWPITYTTFSNIDFGTVKGLTFIYDMRRLKTSGIELQANYTLQFANGTGSDAGSQAALISAGQPNLRTPLPLNYDIRHAINATIDYRFGEGVERVGPKFLENSGFFFVVNTRSGAPYSRQLAATQDVSIGVAQRRNLLGDPNSARLPWTYRIDFTFDKNFVIKGKEIKDAMGATRFKNKFINVYMTVQNILDTRNIVSVYRYTGQPLDDGFLTSPQGEQTLNSIADLTERQAFIDQYSVKMQNPGNFGTPRIIRLGARLNF